MPIREPSGADMISFEQAKLHDPPVWQLARQELHPGRGRTAAPKPSMPALVAIVAVMRTLVIIANALLRDNHTWTPEQASA